MLLAANKENSLTEADLANTETFCFESLKWKKAAQTKGVNSIRIDIAEVAGFELKAIRAESVFDTSVWQLRARIMDMENFHRWATGTVQAQVVHKPAEHIQACYCEYKAPWPVKNRDGVVVQHALRFSDNAIGIRLHAVNGVVEEKKGLVRVDYLRGLWHMEDLGSGQTKLTYQVHSDPNGNIPDWVVNSMITEAPISTIKNLHKSDFSLYSDRPLVLPQHDLL